MMLIYSKFKPMFLLYKLVRRPNISVRLVTPMLFVPAGVCEGLFSKCSCIYDDEGARSSQKLSSKNTSSAIMGKDN